MENKKDKFFYTDIDFVNHYDEAAKLTIPEYELVYKTMLDFLKLHFENNRNVNGLILDIGAGGGAESIKIMENFPELYTVAIDKKETMCDLYKKNYENSQIDILSTPRYKYIIEDAKNLFSFKEFKKKYPEFEGLTCKIAISAYTLHHYSAKEKKAIYKKMYDFLGNDGILINMDLFSYDSEKTRHHASEFDLDFIENNFEKAENSHIKYQKVKWEEHYKSKDHALDSIDTHLQMLREIGFVDVECILKYWQQGVILARKLEEKGGYTQQKNLELRYRKLLVKIKNEFINPRRLPTFNPYLNKHNIKADIEVQQRRLGIFGGAISILSKAEKKPLLLYSPEIQENFGFGTSDFQFLPLRYDKVHWKNGGEKYNCFLDLLYFISRTSSCPEFVKNITKYRSIFEREEQLKIRKKYEILYIDSGEVLFFILMWRLIIELISRNGLNVPINKVGEKEIVIDLDSIFENTDHIEKQLMEKIKLAQEKKFMTSTAKGTYQYVIEAYTEFLHSVKTSTIYDIFRDLGLNKRTHNKELKNYLEFLFPNSNFYQYNKGGEFLLNFQKENEDKGEAATLILELIKAFSDKKGVKLSQSSTLGSCLSRLHKCARFPILPYYFLMFWDKEKELKEQIVFPIWYTYDEHTEYPYKNGKKKKEVKESAVLHALFTVKSTWKNDLKNEWFSESAEQDYLEDYLNDLYTFFSSFSRPLIDKEYYAKEFKKNLDKIKDRATRAAISQLYARTDSHDLGHVLDALNTVEGLNDFEELNGQYQYHEHKNQLLDTMLYIYNDGKKEIKDNYRSELYAYFNRFLKTRMDFRADVATTEPNSLTTLDFYNEIFIPFNNNLVFNNRISGVLDSKLKYKFTIKHNGKANTKVNLPVSIPNDVLGCHAIYIIISNIIRNTIKHSNNISNNDNGEIEFTIAINDYIDNDSFYEVKIYSNVIDKKKNVEKLVYTRNKQFDDTILKEDKLRDSALGTIEMDTCAAYLRNFPVSIVDEEKYNLFEKICEDAEVFVGADLIKEDNTPHIMYAYPEKIEKDKYSLGYKFFLHKSKDILVVYDDNNKIDFSTFKKAGVEYISILELQKSEQTFYHNFLVLLNTTKEIKPSSTIPKRIIHMDVKNISNVEEFKKNCWEKWIKQFKTNVSIFYSTDTDTELLYKEANENNNLKVLQYNHATNLCSENLFPVNGEYHEMICGHHWTKRKIVPIQRSLIGYPSTLYSYLECVKTNVLIIDERIQKNIVLYGKQYGEKIPFALYFEQLGIHIPSPYDLDAEGKYINKTISLIPSDLNEQYKNKHKNDPNLNDAKLYQNQKSKIKKYIAENICKDNTFIVLHLGIIEKLLDQKDEIKDIERINTIIDDLVPKERQDRVVITSGRGKPNNLHPKYSFVSISLLQNAMETLFDKYRLVQILYNSRKSI